MSRGTMPLALEVEGATLVPTEGDENEIARAAQQRQRRRRALIWFARAVALCIIIGGWELSADLKIIDPFFYGKPSLIADQLRKWFESGTAYGSIWLQIGVTVEEAVFGFLYGVAGGIVLGLLLGQFRFLSEVLSPFIKVINALPRIVLGSIFLVAFGLGTTSKVLLASVLVFFVVFFNAFQGVREVDPNFIANARVLGASRWQLMRHVVLPSALTWIIASLHVAFGFAIIGAIVGEFLGAQRGLGLVISTAQNTFNPNGVFAAMVIIAVAALTAEWLIAQLENRLLSWRPPSHNDSGIT